MALPPLNPGSPGGLGSLAQSARSKKLNQARWILIVLGILGIGLVIVALAIMRSRIREELRKEEQRLVQQGFRVDPVQKQEAEDKAVKISIFIGIGYIAVYAAFIIFGIFIKKIPVPATIISLILYIGINGVTAAISLQSLVQGVLFKILIVLALIQAIQAAIAYQKEVNAEREALEPSYE